MDNTIMLDKVVVVVVYILSEEDVRGIKQCGAGLFRKTIGCRVWTTREEAIKEANDLGYEVR